MLTQAEIEARVRVFNQIMGKLFLEVWMEAEEAKRQAEANSQSQSYLQNSTELESCKELAGGQAQVQVAVE